MPEIVLKTAERQADRMLPEPASGGPVLTSQRAIFGFLASILGFVHKACHISGTSSLLEFVKVTLQIPSLIFT